MVVLNIAKAVLLHLATKYAAELLFDFLVKVLTKAAEKTETSFDNDVVEKIKAERTEILSIIKQA